MSSKEKILGTDEAWESERLGNDEKHARAVDAKTTALIDDALELHAISIRLDKSLIESFKMLATFHGIGYQPLMRDALKRFAEAEMKSIVSGVVESQKKEQANKPPVKSARHKERKAA